MTTPLTPLELDGLAETFNIGTSTASTALSKLIGGGVVLERPTVTIDRAEKCYDMIENPDDVKTVVQTVLGGDLSGRLFLILDPAQAKSVASSAMTRSGVGGAEGGMSDSAVLEVANILFGASLAAVGKFLSLNVTHQVPHMATDMAGAALDSVFAELGDSDSDVLALSSAMRTEETGSHVNVLYVFDSAATAAMVDAGKRLIRGASHE